jgi:hypothetical protein
MVDWPDTASSACMLANRGVVSRIFARSKGVLAIGVGIKLYCDKKKVGITYECIDP